MLPFSLLKSQTGNKVGKTESASLSIIGDFINDRYEDIWGRFNWPFLYGRVQKSCVADNEYMVIDARDLDYIVDIHDRTNDYHLNPKSPQRGGREHADEQDSSSTPNVYWPEQTSIKTQPASASQLTIESSSTSDTSQTVRIWGRDASGNELTEEKTLTGTSAVTSANTYTTIDKVSKSDVTDGYITIKSNAGVVTNAIIDAKEYEATYLKIHLVRRPNSAIEYTITYKRKFRRLVNDNDTMLISCDTAVKIGAYADALRKFDKNYDAARQLEINPYVPDDHTTYEGQVTQLIAKYEQWADTLAQGVPHVEKDEIDEVSDNLTSY